MTDSEKTKVFSVAAIGPGTRLNGIYEIDEKIASGGMGEVYRGHNIATDDAVAIKIVLGEFAKDETILALFRKEAKVLGELHHPAIVRYHLFSIEPVLGRPYLAMEYLDGPSLGDKLRDGPLSVESTRILIGRIAAGLDAAHRAGIIHRDVSPDNIILSKGSVFEPKIIDFGIARTTKVGGGTLLGGKFAGKYNFVSPEQLGLFGGDVTAASDVYSLGLLTMNVLRGEPLDMSGSQYEVIEKRRVVPDLSDIDESMRGIVSAMLQPDPAQRLQSMAEVADELLPRPEKSKPPTTPPVIVENGAVQMAGNGVSALLASGGIPAAGETAQGARTPGSTDTAPLIAGSAPVLQAGAPKRRSFAPLAAAAVIGLAVIGGGGWWAGLFGQRPEVESGEAAPKLSPGTSQPKSGEEGKPPAQAETPAPQRDAAAKPEAPAARPQEGKPAEGGAAQTPGKTEVNPAANTALGSAGRQIAWLKAFDGGDCFVARATSVGEKTIAVEGMAKELTGFERLVREFKKEFGFEPNVEVRPITEQQCAVARFLGKLSSGTQGTVRLSLVSDRIRPGDTLSGAIEGFAAEGSHAYLVDNNGATYSLDKSLKTKDNMLTFTVKFQEKKKQKPVAHLILAMRSDKPLALAKFEKPVTTETFFPALTEAVQKTGSGVDFAFEFFILGGE
ncbi:MAG: protein kinase [Phyllobacteriaceae bacterium]|nr:protein kinase [Phyllobacteriaceae bacterium]